MAAPVSGPSRRTRFLILSDTHGATYLPETEGLHPIDVVIHCGDITAHSELSEYKKAIHLLSQIDAPLKLVIAGNHDFTLDTPTYQRMVHRARKHHDFPELLRIHGQPGDARRLFEQARLSQQQQQRQQQQRQGSKEEQGQCDRSDALTDNAHHNNHSSNKNNNNNNDDDSKATGIHYLDEGTYRFRLTNGAALTVYASPYTPAYGTPGFQYRVARPGREDSGNNGDKRAGGHEFAVPDDVDVAITHGPPHSVLDRVWSGTVPSWIGAEKATRHVGAPELFHAVSRARPRMHCFGHIHESWGAEIVRWKGPSGPEKKKEGEGRDGPRGQGEEGSGPGLSSTVIADLGSIVLLKGDRSKVVTDKEHKQREFTTGKCIKTSHCAGDPLPVEKGESTLFVNAALAGKPVRPAWVVDLELPVVGDGDVRSAIDGHNHD